MGFPNIRLIKNRQKVDEDYTNRPILDIIEYITSLKDQVDSLSYTSKRMLITDSSCDDSCLDSQIVYLEQATQKWKPALASYSGEENSTNIDLEESGFIQGLIKNITGVPGNQKGDVYLYGQVENIAINNLLETLPVTTFATYYLSPNISGKITLNKTSALEVFVGKFTSLTSFLFTPDLRLRDNTHQHRWFKLDWSKFQDLGGDEWLYPATEFSVFPPIPLSSTILKVNGIEYDYNDHHVVDSDGLHYTSTEYPPSATNFNAYVYFVHKTTESGGIVTDLVASTENITIFSNETGNEATTGSLGIKLINKTKEISNQEGQTVVKRIVSNEDTGELNIYRGHVVESLIAGTGVSIDNSQGNITISSTFGNVDPVQEISDIHLMGAKAKIIPGTCLSYIEFPKTIGTALVGKFKTGAQTPSNIDIIIYYFGTKDESNFVRFNIKSKIIRLESTVHTAMSVTVKEVPISSLYKKYILFTVKKENLAEEAIVSFEIRRDISDQYDGNFGLFFIGREQN